jgi:ferredoxin
MEVEPELLAGVQMGFNEGIAKTPFVAEIDPERCNYCGDCLRACNAIGSKASGCAMR